MTGLWGLLFYLCVLFLGVIVVLLAVLVFYFVKIRTISDKQKQFTEQLLKTFTEIKNKLNEKD
jgi:FtsH-binding integral membrane protein